jgi:hypothetical protein
MHKQNEFIRVQQREKQNNPKAENDDRTKLSGAESEVNESGFMELVDWLFEQRLRLKMQSLISQIINPSRSPVLHADVRILKKKDANGQEEVDYL